MMACILVLLQGSLQQSHVKRPTAAVHFRSGQARGEVTSRAATVFMGVAYKMTALHRAAAVPTIELAT